MMATNHPDLKIIAGDDQKSGILDRLEPFLTTRKLSSTSMASVITACEGYLPKRLGTGSVVSLTDAKKNWLRAENYGHDIIEDINNYVSGWTDWNLALDTTGGPNWVKREAGPWLSVWDSPLATF
ncbi:hypothetical protein PHYBOEH_003368, partial [Phytophthora boehmeriae]